VRNHLLGALRGSESEHVLQRFEPVRLAQGDALYEPDQPIRYVYFPETVVASLVNSLSDGLSVEVGTVGCEGMVGLPVFLGGATSSTRAIAQIAGTAQRLDAESFTRLASVPGELHELMLRYSHAFLIQVAQTAACNGVHLVQERCARWLLMTHDRVHGDNFPLTHDFLALMLGVRRAGVSVALHALQDVGLIRYGRGNVQILDRERLEEASCGCYRVVEAHIESVLGVAPGAVPGRGPAGIEG
jgi:CRP-like cAMP-binding protein